MRKKYLILNIMIAFIISGCYIYWQLPLKEKMHPLVENENTIQEMPTIIDIIINNNRIVALCEDGSVWSWENKEGKEFAKKVFGLEQISEILCSGSAMYALSKDGFVYVWGSNKWLQINYWESRDKYYEKPVQINALANIVDIEVSAYSEDGRGRTFAIDKSGKLYVWGLHLYWDEWKDYEPGFPEKDMTKVEGVRKIFGGAGNYHYFIREDGTVFSIMDTLHNGVIDFIFPSLVDEELNNAPLSLNDIPYIDLREGAKFALTILYELGEGEEVELIGADQYTMFLYKKDNTLWYWNSKTIEYHDYKEAIVSIETGKEDYSGRFEEVDFKRILGVQDEYKNVPKIVDICAGKENILFLTDDGQVFMSEYITSEVRDVEYYQSGIREWNDVQVKKDLPIKSIVLRKLNFENIVSVNTNGEYCFSAVDENGRHFKIN